MEIQETQEVLGLNRFRSSWGRLRPLTSVSDLCFSPADIWFWKGKEVRKEEDDVVPPRFQHTLVLSLNLFSNPAVTL